MNEGNMPLVPPRLVRYKGRLPRKETIVRLTYDEAIERAGKGDKVFHANPGGVPLTATDIARRFIDRDVFVTVEYSEPHAYDEPVAGSILKIGPNAKYGGEVIFEVGMSWAFATLMKTPEAYEVATEWEERRDAEGLVGKLTSLGDAVAAALAPFFERQGFLRDEPAKAKAARPKAAKE